MKFSKEQIKAINHYKGPALALAVPGSGKTTVLINRVDKLISRGVNPASILSITFSKSQALDMQDRFLSNFSEEKPVFSTIHSFAYSIVRYYNDKNNIKLNIIESTDTYNKYKLIRKLFYEVNGKNIKEDQIEDFFRINGYIKNTLSKYEDYKKYERNNFPNFFTISKKYQKFKEKMGLIDFDDMLVLALKYLGEDKEILDRIRNRYEYIQVDEGQDTSTIQMKLIELISSPKNNLFIVADDDQGIYGFRGADPRSLLKFKDTYPDGKIFFMQENFRSDKYIINAANKLIVNNRDRYVKSIISSRENGEKIELRRSSTSMSQIKYILDNLEGETAILYRNNVSAISLIDQLYKVKKDFYIKDNNISFFESFLLKDLEDIIGFSIDRRDLDRFSRIYFKFNAYLKRDFLSQIQDMDPNQDIIDRLLKCDGINKFYRNKILDLDYNLKRIKKLSLSNKIKYIFESSGYGEYLLEKARRENTQINQYLRYLDTLYNISQDCLNFMDLEKKIEFLKELQSTSSNTRSNISLSTIHAAKGLEYDKVFIIDLIQGEFPSENSMADPGLLEEERRLFYVGMTRAKRKLCLIYPGKIFGKKVKQSIFLTEISK